MIATGELAFVSYARADMEFALTLARTLRKASIPVWLDQLDIRPHTLWAQEIEQALNGASAVLVVLSPAAVASANVMDEASFALDQSKHVIPLICQPCQLPLRLSRLQHIDFTTGDYDTSFDRLVRVLRRDRHHASPETVVEHSTPSAGSTEPTRTTGIATKSIPRSGHTGTNVQAAVTLPSETRKCIFLCYRRDDSEDATGRLHDKLVDTYGNDRLFMDIDTVPGGVDFVDHIAEQMASCCAVIVVIGRSWLTATDHKGRRRLDQADDFVRGEIADTLRQKLPLIPVLVQGASMPHADELPEDIRALARRNAIELSPQRWREDVQRLLKALERYVPPK